MSFPGSLPSYTGFTSSHTLQQDSHAAQHNQEQADIIAIATAYGTGGATAPQVNTVLRGTSPAGTSDWQKVNLTTDVVGVTAINQGGTGASIAANGLANLGGTTLAAALAAVYPVGCIYTETTGVNPATTFGFGTWAATGQGRVLVGAGTSDQTFAAGATGGESNHTLTLAEAPAHTHSIFANSGTGGGVFNQIQNNGSGSLISALGIDSQGGGGAHNNLQPYLVVYFWIRTA